MRERPRRACGAAVAIEARFLGTAVLLVATTFAGVAHAQEFASALPPAVAGWDAMIERGFPPASARPGVAFLGARPLGLPELDTRACVAGIGIRAARLAAGFARTGGAAFGWETCGAAIGAAGVDAGVALRAAIRRDPGAAALDAAAGALGPGVGAEAGGGAWLAPGPGLRAWASAPQVWTRGEAPPLARGLELGVEVAGGDLTAWIVRRAVRGGGAGGAGGVHAAGLGLAIGSCDAWIEGVDRPARAAVGIAVRAGAFGIEARVESHPVLAESAWLALRMGGARR